MFVDLLYKKIYLRIIKHSFNRSVLNNNQGWKFIFYCKEIMTKCFIWKLFRYKKGINDFSLKVIDTSSFLSKRLRFRC